MPPFSPPVLATRAQCQPQRLPEDVVSTSAPVDTPQGPSSYSGADDRRSLKLLFSGGLAGAVSRTATAPLDRLKFLQQASSSSRMTLSQGLAAMAAERSFKAYFRGNGTNVLKNIPETAIKLTLNDRVKSLVLQDGHHISIWERLVIGGLSGAVAQTLIYPLEVIQTRLAAAHGHYAGIADAALKISASEGRMAFFRGWTPAMAGILPYAGMDICLFELLRERVDEQYDTPPAHMLLGAGMLSSSVAQTVAYPLGFVRTRMQLDGLGGRPRQYSGLLNCLAQVVTQEGLRGLYKGYFMSLMKIAPAAGISWFMFEESKLFLHVHSDIARSH